MAVVVDKADMVDDSDDFDFDAVYDVNIKVIGVGGGGGNALRHMAENGLQGVEYIAMNTDVPALKTMDKNTVRRIQLGKKTTRGRGAGGNPEVAAQSATEDRDDIEKALKGATMAFISAGMGGGTGTGAAPVIASIAQEMGILTVGVVTKPFDFERPEKMNQALKGISEMRKFVDALVIIPNQKLLKLNERAINFKQAFNMVDDVLYKVVKSISELLNTTAVVNIDFADLKSTLENSGDAHIAIGIGTGDNKVEDAVSQIVNSPLLETTINNAGKILVSITMSEDIGLAEVDDVMNRLTSVARPDVKVIDGANYDDNLNDTIIVTVIASCFERSAEDEINALKNAAANRKASQNIQNAAAKPVAAGAIGATAPTTAAKDDDRIITTTNGSGLDKLITANLGNLDKTESNDFTDLKKILEKRRSNF